MDVATQLYKLSPVLTQISRLCDRLWGMISNCAIYFTDTPNDKDLRATLDHLFLVPRGATFKSSWTHFRELYKLLDDPRLDLVGYGEHAAAFQHSIIVFARPDSPEECKAAADSLVVCIHHFFNWLRLEREASFGYWGRCFLEYLDDATPIDEMKRFARQFYGPDELSSDSTTSTANTFLPVVPELPIVDEKLFQIRYDKQVYNVSSKGARMVKLLVEHHPEWISMEKHNFTKPSDVKKSLPERIQSLIKTEKGKGYRIPRR